MACFHPISGYLRAQAKGKNRVAFKPPGEPIKLSCGQCIGCRIEKSKHWAIRAVHEASLHKSNSFVTLTYADEHLPPNGELIKSHFQKFLKRLRWEISPTKIRYYMCGEYGDKLGRPHFHSLIFGYAFPDKRLFTMSKGKPLYVSNQLSKLWPFGHASLGEVSFESAGYVARYTMKKITGKGAQKHYERLDESTGEIIQLQPEYNQMSLKPGLGKGWYDKFASDVFPDDFIIHEGKKYSTPEYYTEQLKATFPKQHAIVKATREHRAKQHAENNTPERLAVREKCQFEKTKTSKRTLQ